jgi:peptidoglycan hydrolase CwlO-like protein
MDLTTIGAIIGLLLGLVSLGGLLVKLGSDKEKNAQTKRDVDGIGRKVTAHIEDADERFERLEAENQHAAIQLTKLEAQLNHVAKKADENGGKLDQLIAMHMQERQA